MRPARIAAGNREEQGGGEVRSIVEFNFHSDQKLVVLIGDRLLRQRGHDLEGHLGIHRAGAIRVQFGNGKVAK